MRFVVVIAFFAICAGCASKETTRQAAIMDEIEGSIRLPPGARSLTDYARYYTEEDGSVHGAYTTQIESPRPADYGCEEVHLNGGTTTIACPALADARRGERRWVKVKDYPVVAGANCNALHLAYDPRAKIFTYLKCAEPPQY